MSLERKLFLERTFAENKIPHGVQKGYWHYIFGFYPFCDMD